MFNVTKATVSMTTRDGVRLDADVYRPEAEGEYPVLLMRQPYGRAIASTVVYAHPSWYAARGYIVVIQDVRGRGTSEGTFYPLVNEVADGIDTVAWAATLPSSTGAVGMYGFSYQGMTQLYVASGKHPALKTICPAMMAYDVYADWAYEGGAFCLAGNLSWAIQLEAETARLKGDEASYRQLFAAARNLPLSDTIPANPELLQRLAPDSFYQDWLAHPQPDAYWEQLQPKLETVDLPMLHIGGWFDAYMRGTLHLYQAMASRSQQPQHLVVGPWAHIPWGRRLGAVDYGAAANSPIDRLQLAWFDRFLKGATPEVSQPSIQLFEMGSNQWRTSETYPSPYSRTMFLGSNGLASMREDDGTLKNSPSERVWADTFVHDPWRPVPTLGGHAATPCGSYDRTALDCRTDVVTYTSAPLEVEMPIAGVVKVEVYCRCDRPSFDLCAVLSEVREGGVFNLTQGYRSVRPDEVSSLYQIYLQPTCVRVAKGNCLRLSLSAACFPAYPVNPGTGALPAEARLMEAQITTLTIFHGSDRPSRLTLPLGAYL